MAKKKVQKEESKKGFAYTKELQGLVLILLSITGLGSFGLVGELVKKFAVFLFGSWNFIILTFTLLVGFIFVAKRKKTNFLSARLIGIYTLIIAILLFSHLNYVKETGINNGEIFSATFDNISIAYDTPAEVRNTGGGMIGALFSWIFVSLFDVEGTSIVIVILCAFGIIMLFDITLADFGKYIITPFKKFFIKEEDDEETSVKPLPVLSEEKEDKIDDRIVITSVEELTNRKSVNEASVGSLPEAIEPIKVSDDKPKVYVKPPITLLDAPKPIKGKVNSTEFITANTKILERTFNDFGMHARVIEVRVGPSVTQYEMDLQRGTKVNKVLSISRELALNLAAKEVRIEAPIPGKNTIGVEIPNQTIIPVSMREILEAIPSKFNDSKLLAPLGRDIAGTVKYVEINKTPHMLVAGATGSGKSVCINNIILSILMRSNPDEVKMVLVDPKKVELNVYENIPHLLIPVVTDPKKASMALQKIVVEMDDRYETFKNSQTKNISTYNEYVEKQLKKNPDCGLKKMPFILVIIDELADLMLVAAKEVEESIMRITQLARAAGIHLIVATQRPSTDVITGTIKSNIPTRVAFTVSSSIDSRTILDMVGAEKLLGKGDMLYKPMDENTPTRIQGSFVSDDEIKRVVDFIKNRSDAPKYDDKFMNNDNVSSSEGSSDGFSEPKEKDVLYDKILSYAIETGQISASLIQRRFSIGYNRAARIIDIFEEQGIVGPAKGSKPRDVLVKLEEKIEE